MINNKKKLTTHKINLKQNLLSKINKKKILIGVIGLGYVGLPLSILFAKNKFKVIGFDKNKKKIELLNLKKSYIERIKNREIELLKKRGEFTTKFDKIKKCDVVIICLPTPLKKNNIPDLSFIKKTIVTIKNKLRQGQLLVLESTSYPGTTREEIIKKLNKNLKPGKNFFVGFSSERINPGFNESTINRVPKVVSGFSNHCLDIISSFYQKSFYKIVKSKSLEIAEFSKLLENIYRAVNIGFINEMKFVADKMNIDIYEILKVASTKPFGFRPFAPGPGIGGHCIPIDPHYLYWKAKKEGINANFIKLSAETNSSVVNFILTKIKKILKEKKINEKISKILIIGVAYKRNVDDIRESASVSLIDRLAKKDFKKIDYFDPYVRLGISTKNFKFNKKSIELNSKNLKKFDIVIIMTDHDKLNYKFIYKYSKTIIDCRGRYPVDQKVYRA